MPRVCFSGDRSPAAARRHWVAARNRTCRLGRAPSPGLCRTSDAWELVDSKQQITPCQSEVLAVWPDGSVKWLHMCFLAGLDRDQRFKDLNLRRRHVADGCAAFDSTLAVPEACHHTSADIGLQLAAARGRLMSWQPDPASSEAVDVTLCAVDRRGRERPANIQQVRAAHQGPVRSSDVSWSLQPTGPADSRRRVGLRCCQACSIDSDSRKPGQGTTQRWVLGFGGPGKCRLARALDRTFVSVVRYQEHPMAGISGKAGAILQFPAIPYLAAIKRG